MYLNHRIFNLNRRGFATNAVTGFRKFAEIPGPRPFPIVGCVPYYLPIVGKYDPQRMHRTGLEKYKQFGPIIKEKNFNETMVWLYDPKDIEAVFRSKETNRTSHNVLEHVREHALKEFHHNGGILCTNGQAWSKIRTTFQKNLSVDEILKYIPSVDEITTDIVGKLLDPSMKYHLETDFLNIIFSHICDLTGLNIFGEKWNSIDHFLDKNAKTTELIHVTSALNHDTGPSDHGLKLWRWIPTPTYSKIKKFAMIIYKEAQKYVEARTENGVMIPRDELTLIDAWIRSGKTDYKELVTFLSDLILASTDTVAYTMSFMIYHLSVNLDVQEKLYSELCSFDPNMNTPITPEILKQANYLKKAVKESLRLNPLSIGLGRVMSEDRIIRGYHIPKGTPIVTMNMVTCALPEYVEYPNHFIPERYDADSIIKKMHPFTSVPFGYGARACIGRRLAEQNMYIFLFRLFRRYHVKWNSPRKLDCLTSLINRPDAPLLFKLTPRTR